MDIPNFSTKKQLFEFLVKNKEQLTAQKKAIIKNADGIAFHNTFYDIKDNAIKAASSEELLKFNELLVKAVINTTNFMDSHYDVHIPGLWGKSLRENKMIMHVREHQSQKFDYIISDGKDLKAYAVTKSWRELGYNMDGETEALMFDSIVTKSRNPYMFDQYAKGYVKNHSVGMRYVKLIMAINDEDYRAEYEAWEKYYPIIVNKSFADEVGYFWAVKEAKVIEGSAVPLGSNSITPTNSTEGYKQEPPQGTQKNSEPPQGTQLDYNYLLTNFTLK